MLDAQGGHFGNALQAASLKGSDRIVELLLAVWALTLTAKADTMAMRLSCIW